MQHAVEDRPAIRQEVLDVLDEVADELDPAKQQQRTQQGEQKLRARQLEALNRTQGKSFAKDQDLRQQFHLSDDLAEQIRKQALAQWRQENPPRKELQTYTIQELNMVMCLIPPGRFQMGSPENEPDRDADEKQHWVDLKEPFFLAAHPVTRGQFRRFVQAEKYKTEAELGDGAYGWTGSEWKKDRKFNWQNQGFKQDDDHPSSVRELQRCGGFLQ